MGQAGDRGHGGGVLPVAPEAGHERAVDLQQVDGEALARAEVVDGQDEPEALQRGQLRRAASASSISALS